MTPERRKSLAKGLAKNALLSELFDEFANDIRQSWEATQPDEAETRERYWLQLKTLDDLRDSIYARITDLAGDGQRGGDA